jgi:hypothetical protein
MTDKISDKIAPESAFFATLSSTSSSELTEH